MIRTDVLVIGSGAAGLLFALHCAAQGKSVVLATKATAGESNSAWAQGGVAAALDLEEDSPTAHLSDTLAAGAGLCDEAAAAIVAAEAPQRVEELVRLGVAFDFGGSGALDLTREAAHSAARVAHAADATGRAITSTLVSRALRHPNVTVLERATAVELIVDDRGCRGAWLLVHDRLVAVIAGSATALATGGSGRLFARTTNPPGATADGLPLALRAGAILADLEFVQFHPTALALSGAPALLVSEAARGEGGILVDAAGRRFCFDADPRGELAARDVVARAIYKQLQRDPAGGVRLDLRPIGSPDAIRARFPNISAACARFGIDIGTTPIPVSPAAHYHMGGIRTDLWGRTALSGLYAIGECACTGLHGANRLASNSLAECLVFAARAADDVQAGAAEGFDTEDPSAPPAVVEGPETIDPIAALLWDTAGVEREAQALRRAVGALEGYAVERRPVSRPALEARAVLATGLLIARAALMREESRGSHYRADFPARDDARWRARILWSMSGASFEPVAAPTQIL
ncbi:MAG TPA: L-aspartate oxidase [Candidatus Eremiobacteraceae bacterium]|nr:L-aspartate oxidase [Candidatus Eremiobacteraceae bacterium]